MNLNVERMQIQNLKAIHLNSLKDIVKTRSKYSKTEYYSVLTAH